MRPVVGEWLKLRRERSLAADGPGEVKSPTNGTPGCQGPWRVPSRRILMNFSIPEACQQFASFPSLTWCVGGLTLGNTPQTLKGTLQKQEDFPKGTQGLMDRPSSSTCTASYS